MTRKNIPPPPRGGASAGTATTAPSTSASPYYSLSEIDDDSTAAPPSNNIGTADDTTEIDDDSILEMAKRLDAASVISDPSFIEGAQDYYGGGGGHHPSRGAYRMDDIASEEGESESSSSSDSSSSSSSDSSSNDDSDHYKHHRSNNRGRYESRGSRSRRYNNNQRNHHHHDNSNEGGMRRSHQRRGSGDRSDHNRRRRGEQRRSNHRQQPPQQQSSQPYYDTAYDSGRIQQQQQHNISYQGLGGERERKYSPPRGIDPPIMYTSSATNNNTKHSRGGFRDDPNNDRSLLKNNNSTHEKQAAVAVAYEKQEKREKYYDREVDGSESMKRRRTKMILIPTIVLLIIGVAVAVAVVVSGKGGEDGSNSKSQGQNNDNNAFQPIPVPTTSPTYLGLYQCPYGKSGMTATKGCLGFIQCSAMGTASGPIQYCSSGLLYNVQNGVCDFADNVSCSTNLPTQEDLEAFAPQQTPVTSPTSGVVGVVPPLQNQPSITVGPVTTTDHKVLFEGVSNPGQMDNNVMNNIVKGLEAYLNIFYSPRVISAYNENDYVLESIGNVTIALTANKFEFVQNNRRNLRRHLQLIAIQANGFAMTYQQSTKYDTVDPAITVGDIVRHPYQERYQERIVSYLKAVDTNTFSTLTRVLFVEGNIGGQSVPQPAPAPESNPPPPTRKPTRAPVTNPPTKEPVATVPVTPQTHSIQGFLFFDENNNGIFDYDVEPPFQGVWANLRLCTPKEDGNDYVTTKASGEQGLYKFDKVEEGEYFIEFFKPQPGDDYNFTIPQVAGSDDSVLDSDVVGFTRHGGKTSCFTVTPEFDSTKYINAGYKLKPTPEPTPTPTKSPTLSPVDVSYYCADVATTSDGEENFNFFGCQIRCGIGFSECPGNTRCLFANGCVEPV